jgi:hypothetical protein
MWAILVTVGDEAGGKAGEGVNIRPSAPTIELGSVSGPLSTEASPRHAAPDDEAPKPPDVLESPRPTVMVQLRGAAATAGYQVREWAARPSGRLVLPGVLILAMLAIAGVAGVFVGPRTLDKGKPAAAAPTASAATSPDDGEGPGPSGPPSAPDDGNPLDLGSGTGDGSGPGTGSGGLDGTAGRPADVLATWADPMAAKLGIPEVALQAYAYAEITARRSQPGCNLTWTTLAGIGKIESDHGRAQGAKLGQDGKALPSIVGPPLDGQGGRKAIQDTDGGQLDTDRSWDRAVGPMQFIPATWKQYAVDADNDGVADINDIDDASLAAANYLCASNRDLATPDGWKAAIASYNAVDIYLQDVYNATDDYGRRSKG